MCDLKRPEDTSLCMCGHVADEHVMRRERAECTVCECCQFDWDIDAEEAAATAPKRAPRTTRPPRPPKRRGGQA